MAETLIKRLSQTDYPKELLDVCLVVESDDAVTNAALDVVALPHFIRRIVVPAAPLKTKPRALNYALEPWELEKGFILTCQSTPKTAEIELDFDQT